MKQPCDRDCPDRKAGCGTNCEKWQAYVKERNEMYSERMKQRDFDDMTCENKSKNMHRSFARRRK